MSQCCGKIPTEEDVEYIKETVTRYYEEKANYEAFLESQAQLVKEVEHAREQQKIHEEAESKAERELETLRQQNIDKNTAETVAELQKILDEERGKVVFWQTKTEELEGIGTTQTGVFLRSVAQQNMKDGRGDHYFYDPRNHRSGVAFGGSPRKK